MPGSPKPDARSARHLPAYLYSRTGPARGDNSQFATQFSNCMFTLVAELRHECWRIWASLSRLLRLDNHLGARSARNNVCVEW